MPADFLDRKGHECQRNIGQQSQFPVQPQQNGRADDDQDNGVHGVHDARAEHRSHRIEIVGRPGHDVSRASGLQKRKGHLLNMGQKIIAQVVFDFAAYADQNPPHPEAEKSLHDGNCQDNDRVKNQFLAIQDLLEAIHDIFQYPGRKHAGDDCQDDHQGSQRYLETISGQVGNQISEWIFGICHERILQNRIA